MQHFVEGAHLVAHLGGLLEQQLFGVGQHALLQLLQHGRDIALQKSRGVHHIAGVVVCADMSDAGRRAAFDLVQQAGACAVEKNGVFAGAQAKHLLHEVDGFFHRPGIGIGTEVLMAFIGGATVVRHAREIGGAAFGYAARPASNLEVGVAFVVAKQDVVARLERFDEVIFQNQRFGFRAHHGGFEPGDFAHHEADARAAVVFLEIAGYAPLQMNGFAHIQHLAVCVQKAVHAWLGGQGGYLCEQGFSVWQDIWRCGLQGGRRGCSSIRCGLRGRQGRLAHGAIVESAQKMPATFPE